MRLTILAFTVTILLTACNNNKQEGFIVKGQFNNIDKGHQITLNLLTESNIELFDSTVTNENGEFQFNGKVNNKEFFMLKVDNSNYVYLIIDSLDNITVNGDAKNLLFTYNIEGSNDSKLLQELNRHNYIAKLKIDSLRNSFNSQKDIVNNIDSLKNVIDSAFKIINNKEREYLISFIEKHDTSLASYMALYQQIVPRTPLINPRYTFDFEIFKKVDKALMNKLPASKHVKSLHAQVLELTRMQEIHNMGDKHIQLGAEAIDIAEPSPQGDTIRLSSLRGKYVLLDFWASWCKPCRMENPNLVSNYKKYHDKGFEIYQVSLDKDKNKWIEAIKKDGLDWIHVSDLKYWQCKSAQLYKVQGIPANFLLDPEGKIIAKDLRGAALGAKLAEVLK